MTQTDTTFKPIPLSEPVIGARERVWINRCLDSGFVSTAGELVSEFEKRFAERVGAAYAVSTASGTAALQIALRLSGVKAGTSVAVQDLTFVASVNPIVQLHAEPLLVDVDPARWTMDLDCLEQFLEEESENASRLRAVVPVHLYGCAADMPRLMMLAERFGFMVVEDATEALGTTLNGQQVGTFGDFGCFSFNGNKMMTTGAGGMIVTQSAKLAERARYLVSQAREPGAAYLHGTDGYNFRMPNLNAALGLAQLEQLDELMASRKKVGQYYRAAFKDLPSITLSPEPAGVDNCYWLSSILADSASAAELLMAALNHDGIMARPFFLPLHEQSYLQGARGLNDGEWASSNLAARGINLPSSPCITDEQLRFVVDRLSAFIR